MRILLVIQLNVSIIPSLPPISLYFSFYADFFSRTFMNHRTAGEGGGHSLISSLPLPPASKILRHQPGDYCRELTFAHCQQPDPNREPLVTECKSLTTKLHAIYPPLPPPSHLCHYYLHYIIFHSIRLHGMILLFVIFKKQVYVYTLRAKTEAKRSDIY